MSNQFTVVTAVREDQGKGASRRLRHAGKMPAIIYGGHKNPVAVTLISKDLRKQLENEAFYSHILTLSHADGSTEQAVLKDLQRHPWKQEILLHADFLRVSANETIKMHVPLHFNGEDVAPGVKLGGGKFSHLVIDVEVECLPANLPEYVAVDVSGMALNQVLHLSDLVLPEGVTLVALAHGDDAAVIALNAPAGGAAE